MKLIMIGTFLGAALCLAACDAAPDSRQEPAPAAKPKEKAKPRTVNQPVEDAMMRIPPDLRLDYQKAYICEVNREKAKSRAIDVTPAYVDDLMRRLKERPSIKDC